MRRTVKKYPFMSFIVFYLGIIALFVSGTLIIHYCTENTPDNQEKTNSDYFCIIGEDLFDKLLTANDSGEVAQERDFRSKMVGHCIHCKKCRDTLFEDKEIWEREKEKYLNGTDF